MGLLHLLAFAGLLGVVFCFRCHVVDNVAQLHCGDVRNMSCSSVQYTPYCHQRPGDTSQMNGVCTCERYCFADTDCGGGCPQGTQSKCQEAYKGSLESICLCPIATSPVG